MGWWWKKKEEKVNDYNSGEPLLQDLYLRGSITKEDFDYYNSPIVPSQQFYSDLLHDGRISSYDIPEMYRYQAISDVEHARKGSYGYHNSFLDEEEDGFYQDQDEHDDHVFASREEEEEERSLLEQEEEGSSNLITPHQPSYVHDEDGEHEESGPQLIVWEPPTYAHEDTYDNTDPRLPNWEPPSYHRDEDDS